MWSPHDTTAEEAPSPPAEQARGPDAPAGKDSEALAPRPRFEQRAVKELALTEPFGFVLDRALIVRSVAARSQATRRGVEVGMMVAEVDGVPVHDAAEWDAEIGFVKQRFGADVLEAHLTLRHAHGVGSFAPPKVQLTFEFD